MESYFDDVATVVVATASLALVLVVLWCLDSHLKNINIQYVQAEHL